MPKPSIFSRDYDEKMRKRKRIRSAILGVLVVLVILISVFGGTIKSIVNKRSEFGFDKLKTKITGMIISKNYEKEKIKNTTTNNKEILKEDNKVNEKSSQDKVSKNENDNKKNISKVEEQLIKLSNEQEIKLQYNMINNKKQYIGILPNTINYDISPSKQNIILIENLTQNMIIIDNKGNIKDITKKQYVSSKGTIFDKNKILQNNKEYIWCSSPKFLNEDSILYMSQLPWFNKGSIKYLWKYSISTDKHQHNLLPQGGEIEGKKIIYGNISPQGIEIIFDGKKAIIK